MRSHTHAFLCLFLLFAALPLSAQVSAVLSGTVTDPSGGVVPAASITLTNTATGMVRATQTDAGGLYRLPSLPVGVYEIRVAKPGFADQLRTGVQLVVGQYATIDFTLQVGESRQQVAVHADAALVDVATQDITGLVDERQIRDLPLNGRSYDELLTLNPGVVNFTWAKTGGVGVSNSTAGNNFAVSGNRPQQNLFLLNGVEFTGAAENNMQPGGVSQELLGVDAVREFNLLRDSYGAEYGKHPGAQVLIVTQSGTNQWHGSTYEFLRNNVFDARNFFDGSSVPGFERNEFGGALGGPIRKDKTFMFANYEGLRQHLHQTGVDLVPDNNARAGYLPCKLVSPAPSPCPTSGLAFVGVSPLISLWAAPTAGAPDFGGISEALNNPLQTIRDDFGTLRLDHNFSRRDFFSAIYTIDDSADFTPTSTNLYSTDITSLREQVLSAQETHVFSPVVAEHLPRGLFPRGLFLHRRTHARHARGGPARLPRRTSHRRRRRRWQRRLESHRPTQSGRQQQRQQPRRRPQFVHLRRPRLADQGPPSDRSGRLVPTPPVQRDAGAQPVWTGHLHQPANIPRRNHRDAALRSRSHPHGLAVVDGRVVRSKTPSASVPA